MIHLFRLSHRKRDTVNEALQHHDNSDNSEDLDLTEQDQSKAEEDEIHPPPAKIQRFELKVADEENEWELPTTMEKYVSKYTDTRIAEKDLKEKVTWVNPVPSNIKKPEEIDSYIKDLLVEHNKTATLHTEKILKSVQEKVHNILGPLSKLWLLTEEERESVDNEDERSHFQYIVELFEQSVLLTSQAVNRIRHQRRYNVLSTLIDNSTKVKDMLKSKADEMNLKDNKCFFGEKFEEHVSKSSKAKRKSTGIFTGLSKKVPSSSLSSSQTRQGQFRNHQPFRNGSLSHQGSNQRGRGQQSFFARAAQRGGKSFLSIKPMQVLDLPNVHPLVKNLFLKTKVSLKLPASGRLSHFYLNWECLTQDQEILQVVKGFSIPLSSQPKQKFLPPLSLSQEEIGLVDTEIMEMLRKGAIQEVKESQDQILSSIFLVAKKDSGYRPVINLKNLNKCIPYIHFKIEGLYLVKDLLQPKDYMCKIDLKDAYFSVPLNRDSQHLVCFKWKGKIYQFLCLCFGLGPAPRIFTKLLKIPIAILRRLNVRLIIFLDDILIFAQSRKELDQARDTLIFLLQNLGFLINLRKSEFQPTQHIQFLGVEMDSTSMTVSLPQEKVQAIIGQCQNILEKTVLSLRELYSLVKGDCHLQQ